MFENIMFMFATITSPYLILIVFGGVLIGITIGVLPGLNASMGVAVLLPLAYALDPLPAIMLFFGLYTGAVYGGSVSAILINAPGTTAAAATTFDGYPMSQNGQTGRALGMAAIASGIGGVFSTIVLIFLAPTIARYALAFGPGEFAFLSIFGISLIIAISSDDVVAGLVSATLGVIIGLIGMDVVSGVSRFNFGSIYLHGGIDFLVVLIGMFAMSEVFLKIEKIGQKETIAKIKGDVSANISFQDIKDSFKCIVSGCFVGTGIGALPGAGATVATFINYGIAQRFSKNKANFGKGAIEGVAAAESANNAAAGGAMIPLLTLGIPGSGTTAVMLGALMMLGITPGPRLFVDHADLIYGWFGGFFLANIMFVIVALLAVRFFSKISLIPIKILFPVISMLSMVGAFAFNNRIGDMVAVLIFGAIGYAFKKLNVPITPMVIALILMPIIEDRLRMSMMIHGGRIMPVLQRPIVMVLIALTFISVFLPGIIDIVKNKIASN